MVNKNKENMRAEQIEVKNGNRTLRAGRGAKNDEFYTQLSDIEKELWKYRRHFAGKVVLCNCDDPRVSGFFHYFSYNFEKLKLKKLITTCYKNQDADLFSRNDSKRAVYLEYSGERNGELVPSANQIGIKLLKGDGDFRSEECIELLKQADIIVTNPPFSLFREYVAQLMEHNKKFLIVGSDNAITYRDFFGYIKANRVWTGYHKVKGFKQPDGTVKKFGNIGWFTNLSTRKHKEDLILFKKYRAKEYPKYDNYNAINVDKTAHIPCDYAGLMGVPIAFLDKFNPEQFEIIGIDRVLTEERTGRVSRFLINGQELYARVVIRNRRLA